MTMRAPIVCNDERGLKPRTKTQGKPQERGKGQGRRVRESIELTSERWGVDEAGLGEGREGKEQRGKWCRAWKQSSRGRMGSQLWMEGGAVEAGVREQKVGDNERGN